MTTYLEIKSIHAREILDSRGNPTVETDMAVLNRENGQYYIGSAAVPSGASTGRFEAVELRDGEPRYFGLGVQHAVKNVNEKIAPSLLGKNALNQMEIDRLLVELDGTENKENLGANATLSVSLACAKASAKALAMPLYRYVGGAGAHLLPVPMMNILNGGKHAANTVDFQEFMIMPVGACCFKEGLRMCAEIYHTLKGLLKKYGYSTAVGDEGGFAPDLPDAKEALRFIMEAVQTAGYKPREDIKIALDVAATELYDKNFRKYAFEGESKMHGHQVVRSAEELIDYYEELAEEFPIASIEDPLDEEDWEGWEILTTRLGVNMQLVGDDLFVTNADRLKKGIDRGVANAILIKVNQIGTLTEAFNAIEMAKNAGYRTIVSHRSGETADSIIADIAVAFNSGQIKTGAPCRSERVEKYNQLLRIEERLGDVAEYRNPFD